MKLIQLWLLVVATLTAPLPGTEESDASRADGPAENHVERFLNQRDTPLTTAVAFRHLVASTKGGAMTGWVDACTAVEGDDLRYWIVAEGGSGVVRRRALLAALEGEVRARRQGDTRRASLDRANYEFATEEESEGVLRIALTPRRKDAMLIDGAMFLATDSADLVRVEGRLVKAPSFWTRRVEVVRRYSRLGGVRVPVSMESTAQVMIVGTSTFSMSYTYLSINGETVVDVPAEAQVCGASAAQQVSQ